MTPSASVALAPIIDSDVQHVARYLHRNLNRRVPASAWTTLMMADWDRIAPNHGFFLSSEGVVVGACLAVYSTRTIEGVDEPICNLGALCVDPDYRLHVVRLLRAVLNQGDYTFTDLSPSGSVIALNERLGFQHLDTATALVANVPSPRLPRRIHVITRHVDIADRLDGEALRIFRGHQHAAASHHVLLSKDHLQCYVIYRRTKRKKLPLFTSILYVSDREAFARLSGALYPYLLLHHGTVATLAELRVVGAQPPRSALIGDPRPKMYRSAGLGEQNIDYLYSELTCLAW